MNKKWIELDKYWERRAKDRQNRKWTISRFSSSAICTQFLRLYIAVVSKVMSPDATEPRFSFSSFFLLCLFLFLEDDNFLRSYVFSLFRCVRQVRISMRGYGLPLVCPSVRRYISYASLNKANTMYSRARLLRPWDQKIERLKDHKTKRLNVNWLKITFNVLKWLEMTSNSKKS